MILGAENLGRNDLCHCGSGKKYKQCCLEIDERKAHPKALNKNGLMAIFRKMLSEAEGGEYKISFLDIEQIPHDEGINVHYNPEDDSFTLKTVKIEVQKIITPDKRLRVPIGRTN